MGVRTSRAGVTGALAGVLILVAVLARVLTVPLPVPLRAAEGVIAVLAGGFVVASFGLSRKRWRGNGALLVLYSLTPSLLATLGLRLAAAYVPSFELFAVLVFAALLLSVDLGASRIAAGASIAVVLIVFAALWLTTEPLDTTAGATLAVALAMLLGLALLSTAQRRGARETLDAEVVRGRVYALLSRRLGTARDLPTVAAGLLETCREAFPQAGYGSLFLLDDTDGLLKPLPVQLGPDRLTSGGVSLELVPSEGLAGAAFSGEGPRIWPTAIDVSMAEATLREVNRARIRLTRDGFPRSAVGVPLRHAQGAVIGSLVLSCHRRENAWSADDLPMLEALGVEAAQALERARGHAADVDLALLDSITGLATHRQLVTIIDKEVSRAKRSETRQPVAVIFSDLDSFKQINDAWGHDTGNRVLRLFADVLRHTLRREDTAARYGGDEFVCVLPGADRAQAAAIADRIRQQFTEASGGGPMGAATTSVSSGIAVFPTDASDPDSLLAAADAELLRAKQRRAAERELPGRAQDRAATASG